MRAWLAVAWPGLPKPPGFGSGQRCHVVHGLKDVAGQRTGACTKFKDVLGASGLQHLCDLSRECATKQRGQLRGRDKVTLQPNRRSM